MKSAHTLVPRPETELLVMEGLKLLKPLPRPQVLELGVVPAVSHGVAVNHKGAQIVGIELKPDTRDVAQGIWNATKSPTEWNSAAATCSRR